jgi:hypothetical protein
MADGRHEAGANVESAEITIDGQPLTGASVPTQSQYPWKTFWRTVLQVGPVALAALLGVLPVIINDFLETFKEQLPPEVYAWLAAAALTITLAAAFLSRAMAALRAVEFFRKYLPAFAPDKK